MALLDVDPELAGGATSSEVASLRNRLTAPVIRLDVGVVSEPSLEGGDAGSTLGYLLLKGLLLYEVSVFGRSTAELLGPGDVIRPWPDTASETLVGDVKWSALEPTLLGDLSALTSNNGDRGVFVETLLARCARRADAVALQRTIAAHVRVDVRVLAYLWHLADRWGVVTPGAVRLDMPLTHTVLARLVGARRPTVTTALQRLIQLGYLKRENRAFILVGDASAVFELESRSPARDFALPGAAV